MNKNVLVVEDDPLSQFVIVEMCKDLGYDCHTANDGQEAIEALAEHANSINLVLMDLHMPIISGLDATKAVRQCPNDPPRKTPIVAVTADVLWHDQRKAKEHGFDCVLAKPLDFELLSQTLQTFAKTA